MNDRVYVLMARSGPDYLIADLDDTDEVTWVHAVYENYDRAIIEKEKLKANDTTSTYWVETHKLIKND